jgi:hypothetical protein
MINLDARYHHYLEGRTKFCINNVCEAVLGYGWTDDGKNITGYYVQTENRRLFYNLEEKFIYMKEMASI